jgi:hypothetical protein
MYYIGDWEDEYCDLTLDKMVSEMKTTTKRDIVSEAKTPKSLEEFRAQLNAIKTANTGFRFERSSVNEAVVNGAIAGRKPGIFSKIKTFLHL